MNDAAAVAAAAGAATPAAGAGTVSGTPPAGASAVAAAAGATTPPAAAPVAAAPVAGAAPAAGAAAPGATTELGKAAEAALAAKLELKPPAELKASAGFLSAVEKWATEQKLSSEQANSLWPMAKAYAAAKDAEVAQGAIDRAKEWAAGLTKEHGANHPQAVKDAAEFARQFGDKDLIEVFEKHGMGNHPGLFRALAKAGAFIRQKLSEDSSAVPGARPGGGGGNSPKERNSKLNGERPQPRK